MLVDCLSSGNPVHLDHASAVKKRDHQKFVGGFALSGLLGSGRASMLPLGTVSRSLGHSSRSSFHCMAFFPSLKQNFIAYRSSSHPDCIFEIHQLWQSGLIRVYSNCCCSCSFEPEIIKIGQSSHKMYSNNILNFRESTTILNTCTKSLETYWRHHVYKAWSIMKYTEKSFFSFSLNKSHFSLIFYH